MCVFLVDKKERKEYSLSTFKQSHETNILYIPYDGPYDPH